MKNIAGKISCLLIVLFQTQLSLEAQPVFISGSIDSKDLKQINFYQFGVKSNGDTNKKYSAIVQPNQTFSLIIKNPEEGMYKIGDAYVGHKIFISPGDTVRIRLEKITKPSFEIFHTMSVRTKYPMNYMFFDSCLSFFGRVKPQFDKSNFDGNAYKKECMDRYNKALDLLMHFHKGKQVSDKFFKYAQIELKSTYFDWLIFPFAKYNINKPSNNPDYFKELENYHFNELDAIAKTEYYLYAASEYNNFVLNTPDKNDPASSLYSTFTTAANHFEGFVSDQLMAWKIDEIIRFNPGDSNVLNSVLHSFFQKCKTPFLRDEIAAKSGELTQKLRNAPAWFQQLMERAFFANSKGNTFSMNTLPINKDWLLIDCWASWCKPCKEQYPFFEDFRRLYHNRIAFLNLSLDKDKTVWQKDIKNYNKNPQVNYLLTEGDDNAFTYYFNISTIPRFILIDLKNKKVANANMPFPANKNEFEQAIKQALNEKTAVD